MDKCIVCESNFEDAGCVCHNCYMKLEERIKQLEDALMWFIDNDEGMFDNVGYCTYCGAKTNKNHTNDCPYGNALRALKGE